jgi:glycosyltransferase involved in cell wall biosynthesis
MMDNFEGGFTVLMSVYKGDDALLFEKALNSIFSNTLLPNNFILVVDGEVPVTLNEVILKHLYRKSFFVHRIKNNSGLANALNVGLSLVNTEWVVRADADDINLKFRFEMMANFAKTHKNLDIIGANILECDSSGEPLSSRLVPELHDSIVKYMKFRSPMNHMTVCYKKNAVISVGGYPNLHLKEDYGLWALLVRKGFIFGNLNKTLVHATTGPGMFKRRGGLKYVISELKLQYLLFRTSINGPFLAFFLFFLRSGVFLLPIFVRKYFYLKILRKKST